MSGIFMSRTAELEYSYFEYYSQSCLYKHRHWDNDAIQSRFEITASCSSRDMYMMQLGAVGWRGGSAGRRGLCAARWFERCAVAGSRDVGQPPGNDANSRRGEWRTIAEVMLQDGFLLCMTSVASSPQQGNRPSK